jgi:hypothetical protein
MRAGTLTSNQENVYSSKILLLDMESPGLEPKRNMAQFQPKFRFQASSHIHIIMQGYEPEINSVSLNMTNGSNVKMVVSNKLSLY